MLAPEGSWRHCFSHHPFDVELAYAEGVYLYDTKGKRYIDASGGPMSVNIGHGDARMKAALSEQLAEGFLVGDRGYEPATKTR
ncbi:aminotransferase class III-fold pyridoxal phosphate-dependent enzyme [Cupriavidus sp. AcVe19-6a]|uniref:aminotransferase class III-fold pyridoxal phosphate-dependent enzyme n=1 Tax=Cupriavidus sp. AcVe19-6a TaxID=2821358 RepID=UPI001AE4557B|nr:aminotransferase class III-fold pyridoxal phosphate-dependent enzyme [Cupriavidus sp. AcVe19-6a]